MKRIRRNICIFVLMGLFTACEDGFSEVDAPEKLVVEAYLYAGERTDHISISKTLSFASNDTVFKKVSNADVSIIWNDQTYNLIPSDSAGFYHYPGSDLIILEEETYYLNIDYDGENYTSKTTVPEKTKGLEVSAKQISIPEYFNPLEMLGDGFEQLEIRWDNPDNSYYYVLIKNIEPDPEPIETGFSQIPRGGGFRFSFLSMPFQSDRYMINPFTTLEQYGKHIIRVYHVNEEYARLYEYRVQDSRSMEEPFSNINNGLGIFTSFSSKVDTIEVVKR